ncbi:hypothetical protein GmHk_01G001083 [Glycine max]|nr:hypothetical protein GmHk_01G001083 [Glycine max]
MKVKVSVFSVAEVVGGIQVRLGVIDEDQWMYESIMSEEVDMDYQNEEECGVNEPHVDCSDAFNTSQVFDGRKDVLRWARSVVHENEFVAVIIRSNTNTSSRGRTSFVLIGCERSGEYRRDIGTRKCGCPFKLRGKPMVGGQGWMVKLMCGIHNHELAKSLVGHPYVRRLTKAEKILTADMTKSMVKPRNILLTLKEHNANSCTTIKQIYNARSAYRSSIRGSDTEMQHLMKLLERDQLKDEDVVRDIFWCHPDAVKLANACNLVLTPAARFCWGDTNWDDILCRFCISGGRDVLPGVIVTNRDLALMNAVKTVFLECTNLLCNFHINKNVKAKCKLLIGQRNAWEYGTLVDCPSEQQFDECLKKFEMVCSPWPMFVDHVKETWIIPHKENFVSAWTNKVMHLGNTKTNRVESAHWVLKRVLQNSLGDLCIHMSLDISSKKPYALNQIAAEFERVHYVGKNPSACGCVMRSTHDLPCACELSNFLDQGLSEPEVSIKEEMETISKRFEELDVCGKFTLKTKLWEIAYPDQNSMCPPPVKVNTKGQPKKPMNRNPRSTKRDPSYWEYVDAFDSMQNSNSSVRRSASSSEQPNLRAIMPMLDQFQPFIHDFIHNIVDVKVDGNCGYWSIVGLLGMGEDSWSLVRTHLLKELRKFSDEYMKLFGGKERFEELRMSLLVDGLTKVTMDKWMDITDMRYVIASRYNVILVSLSQ